MNAMPYNMSMDTFNWNSPEAHIPMFEDNFLQLQTASSNTSHAPSLYDGESYVQSPTSPTFSSVVSQCSGAQSIVMSPATSVANTPPATDYDNESEPADSDEVLEGLLADLEPGDDGKYHCEDVNAEGHACEFSADRKCMLRKHLESTLKTNICRHADCNGMQFSSKAVLTRHEKEAHGMHAASQFFCPVPTCDRHARGFPREYNMGDHITRVHRDLDVTNFLKKTKRTRKISTSSGSAATVSASRSNSATGAGIRKQSSSKARKDRLEKQYKNSKENIVKVMFKLPDHGDSVHLKYLQQLKAEVAKLEDAINGLQSQNPASND